MCPTASEGPAIESVSSGRACEPIANEVRNLAWPEVRKFCAEGGPIGRPNEPAAARIGMLRSWRRGRASLVAASFPEDGTQTSKSCGNRNFTTPVGHGTAGCQDFVSVHNIVCQFGKSVRDPIRGVAGAIGGVSCHDSSSQKILEGNSRGGRGSLNWPVFLAEGSPGGDHEGRCHL